MNDSLIILNWSFDLNFWTYEPFFDALPPCKNWKMGWKIYDFPPPCIFFWIFFYFGWDIGLCIAKKCWRKLGYEEQLKKSLEEIAYFLGNVSKKDCFLVQRIFFYCIGIISIFSWNSVQLYLEFFSISKYKWINFCAPFFPIIFGKISKYFWKDLLPSNLFFYSAVVFIFPSNYIGMLFLYFIGGFSQV